MQSRDIANPAWFKRISLGCGGLVLLAYLGLWLLSRWLEPAREIGQAIFCQSNVKQLTRGLRMYADDYDDRFPPAPQWMDRVIVYTDGEKRLRCPSVARPEEPRYGYAMNRDLGGKARSGIEAPEKTPLVYDSTALARSASDAVTSLPVPGRHQGRAQKGAAIKKGNLVGFADGGGAFRVTESPGSVERK